jgi:hypothetical protein|nr:hypothetical protein [Neorhizobium tomejilense]
MKLAHDTRFALIVYRGEAQVAKIRKDRGPGYTVFSNRGVFSVSEYEEQLGVYTDGNGDYLDLVHVVAQAPTESALPDPASLVLPRAFDVDAAMSAIREEIKASRLSKQMKDYLGLLLADHNRITMAHPFMGRATDGGRALKMAVQKMASWEAALFAGMSATIAETLASGNTDPMTHEAGGPRSEIEGRAQSDFARRVQTEVVRFHQPAPVAPVPADPDAVERQCRQELEKLLADTMEKLSQIDRRLINNGPVPAWRETLGEVFEAAMQASRDLDYKEYKPRPAGRRPR